MQSGNGPFSALPTPPLASRYGGAGGGGFTGEDADQYDQIYSEGGTRPRGYPPFPATRPPIAAARPPTASTYLYREGEGGSEGASRPTSAWGHHPPPNVPYYPQVGLVNF